MPSDLKLIHNQTFIEGINTVTARELVKNTQAHYILNCNVLSTANGEVGIVTNLKGNIQILFDLPLGDNKCIGVGSDEETNNLYFAIWNSNKYHTWYQLNTVTGNVTKILQNLTDSNDVSLFNWEEGEEILHVDIVRNELLYWVIEGDTARKFNISKALDKSTDGYGVTVLEEYTRAYKKTSVFSPACEYFSDTSIPFNRLYGYQFKFAQRYIYDDYEKSNWSDWSNVPLPDNEPFTGINQIPTNNNGIKITVETGSDIVRQIEIAMLQTSNIGGILNWVSIATLDKSNLSISSNSSYIYNFYNDGAYSVTDQEKIIRPYSYLPYNPKTQAFVKNAMVYSNFDEGFDNVNIDVAASISYEDLFISSGTENILNEPDIVLDLLNKYREESGFGYWKHTVYRLTIGSDVKKGNKFELFGNNGESDNYYYYYTATLIDSASTVANQLRSQIILNWRYKDVTTVTNDGSGNYYFEFDYKGQWKEPYTWYSGHVNPVNYNSLKDTGQSINNIKMGSSTQYGIIYEDEDGRKSLTYTGDNLITKINSINQYAAIKAVRIELTINHQPPLWAKYYQIVRSKDLTYGNYIQMLIQKVVSVVGTSDEDYLDLVVGSLFTYQKLHENTTLVYDFNKGDRIRLIKSIDTGTLVETYYDFYETEIISYKPVSEQTLNQNVTVNGTTTVTVESSSADNIGSYIIINGVEREIISAPTGTTYIVDNKIAGDGTNGTDPAIYLNYKIINRNGVLRIKKPASPTIINYSLIEIYTPSLVNSEESKQFYEFGYKFHIINWGTSSAYHGGNVQIQSSVNPAIVEISNGIAYVRNRELPINNQIPNTQVIISPIEDPSFSDFYISNLNDNGRINAKDNGDGKVHFGSRFRYSNNFIEDTRINGLNDFDNADREDYNDKYGDVQRIVFGENRLYVFKQLRNCWIPVLQTIMTDATESSVVGTSTKLLNNIQYFAWDGGIGNNPEAYCRNGLHHYMASSNSGVIIRIGGDGETPISEIYQVDNEIRNYLNLAAKNNLKIHMAFNRKNNVLEVSFSDGLKLIFNSNFNEQDFVIYRDLLPNDQVYTIESSPTHGTLDLTDPSVPIYIPNTNYIGPDYFSYSTIIDGNTVITSVCIDVIDIPQDTAWRPKESSAYCVLDEYLNNTGYKGYTTLEEYGKVDKLVTGNEKPNDPSDPDYIDTVYDLNTCPICESPTLLSLVPNSPNLDINFTTSIGCTTLTVQTSIDDGINWSNNTGACTSPRQILLPSVQTKVRLIRNCSGADSAPSNELTYIPSTQYPLIIDATNATSGAGVTEITIDLSEVGGNNTQYNFSVSPGNSSIFAIDPGFYDIVINAVGGSSYPLTVYVTDYYSNTYSNIGLGTLYFSNIETPTTIEISN